MGDTGEDLTPRNYQMQLFNIALKQNSIIFLPTGTGKTYIALMVLKKLSRDLSKPYGDGGKISIFLVNTVALVDQHAKYIRAHTVLSAGCYSGEMNLDFWPREKWYEEYNKYQVLVMTAQILSNLVGSDHIDLNKVNLLIFDECHHGVCDHSMRQLMRSFEGLYDPPRVIGLTATLLNGNCNPLKVMENVRSLEITYRSQVATVEGLDCVVGYSTNPQEEIVLCDSHEPTSLEAKGISDLKKLQLILNSIEIKSTRVAVPPSGLSYLEPEEGLKSLINLIGDLIIHIEMTGSYGGIKSCLASIIKIERLKKHCDDKDFFLLLNYVATVINYTKETFRYQIDQCCSDAKDKILNFSSDKVLKLIKIFRNYKKVSKEELCAIVFTQRRITAKILYHILSDLVKCDNDFSHVKPNFMVGHNNNPYNDTREHLYLSKKNKQILDAFSNKEFNVLTASNVLEEGVDIPKCTMVVKFDKPEDYRSYIQSKGRARHKKSLYYIIVERENYKNFMDKYSKFQLIEKTLNDFLIGKNEDRVLPSESDLNTLYNEDDIPPYFVNGLNSAKVTMVSAIPLLCQYCNSLPSDKYTRYTPDWFVRVDKHSKKIQVVITLPIVCPLRNAIAGPFMFNKKKAKRAAALECCKLLHQCGELDDHLLPKIHDVTDVDTSFLFPHYPQGKDIGCGTSKRKRLHKKLVAECIRENIEPEHDIYLHIIHLTPQFERREEVHQSTLYDIYNSSQCYGLLTAKPIPIICDFPVYVSIGTIDVSLKVNQKKVRLSENELQAIKQFHYTVFKDVLEIFQNFFVYDASGNSEMMLLVPADRNSLSIDFLTLFSDIKVKEREIGLSLDEKKKLVVTQENYLRKIVTPWYRPNSTYIVTEICFNKNPSTDFPNTEFSSFEDYYLDKYHISVWNKTQPLVLVKGLSKRLNVVKPRGLEGRRKREKCYEEMEEYLIPEMLVKQEFPSTLWIQANLLPTILTRTNYLLLAEEFRRKVAFDCQLHNFQTNFCKPLELDLSLLNYKSEDEEQQPQIMASEEEPIVDETDNFTQLTLDASSSKINLYNKEFAAKILESEYPWKEIDEPKDVERNFDITPMDIEYYEKFVSQKVTDSERLHKSVVHAARNLPALTFPKNFVPKQIKILGKVFNNTSPELCEIYRALTTCNAHDIVNLERLETLGDSYLKYAISAYIMLRFPSFNEGQLTELKGRMVSNRNLYYLAQSKNIGGILRYNDLSQAEEWVPPCYTVPTVLTEKIIKKNTSGSSLYNIQIPSNEQINGDLSMETLTEILQEYTPIEDTEENMYSSIGGYLGCQYIGDKYIADAVESLVGAYFEANGIESAHKFIQWMGIVPKHEQLEKVLNLPPPNPVLNNTSSQENIDYHITNWEECEKRLGYNFKNRAYLLQALTHSSYSPNRITLSYQKLEFIGDAVLDFLITCFIYEHCGPLNPGDLTDLRSALVNNNTFASLLVRLDLHKFILSVNLQLETKIFKFADFLANRNYKIDDEVLILLEEDDMNLAEYVDVPKTLGDVFEALAGAIYYDSGKNLETVWNVFYKIMWKEIDMFSQNIPRNVVRRIFEWPGNCYPKFNNPRQLENGSTMVSLDFLLNGRKMRVYGFGTNKVMAKKAAAKIALRSLTQ